MVMCMIIFIVVDIDNVNNDKSPFSNVEGEFRGMGLMFKIHGQNNNFIYNLMSVRKIWYIKKKAGHLMASRIADLYVI